MTEDLSTISSERYTHFNIHIPRDLFLRLFLFNHEKDFNKYFIR